MTSQEKTTLCTLKKYFAFVDDSYTHIRRGKCRESMHTLWLPLALDYSTRQCLTCLRSDHSDDRVIADLPSLDHSVCTQSPLVSKI